LGFPTGWSFNYTPPTLFWCYLPAIKLFSGAVAGEEVEDLCKGIFSHSHPLLCFIVLLYFIYFYLHHFLSKTQKIRILGSCYFFTLVHYVVP
jgi:hypothetical protein